MYRRYYRTVTGGWGKQTALGPPGLGLLGRVTKVILINLCYTSQLSNIADNQVVNQPTFSPTSRSVLPARDLAGHIFMRVPYRSPSIFNGNFDDLH